MGEVKSIISADDLIISFDCTCQGWQAKPNELTDGGALDTSTLEWLLDGVIRNLSAGKRVDVGCWAGHGRTGTFLSCLVVKLEGLNAYQAINSSPRPSTSLCGFHHQGSVGRRSCNLKSAPAHKQRLTKGVSK